MKDNEISVGALKEVLRRLHNWKTAGPDEIQNFWYKQLSLIHK